MKYFKLSLMMFSAGFLLAACGSDDGGGGGAQPKTNQTYYLSDGDCYRSSNNERTDRNRCDALLFYIEDGECFRKADNAEVAISNCTTNSYFRGDNACYDRDGDKVSTSNCTRGSDSDNDFSSGSLKDNYENVTCSGVYIEFASDGVFRVRCDGQRSTGNCSDWVLFDESKNKFVYCL